MGNNINANEIYKHIGDYIKKVMRDKGITQQNLAKDLSVSQSTIASYLNGNASIPIDNLFRICYLLGISMDKVTGLDEILYSSENISLSNVCESLSSLNNMVPLKFSKIKIGEKSYNCLYSNCENVDNTVLKFAEIINCCDGDEDVFNTWKKSFIEKNKTRLKKYSFNTIEELVENYSMRWIKLTFEQTELYRRIDNSQTYSKEISYNALVKSCEMHYTSFSKTEASILYSAIDDCMKKYLKNSAEYISLDIFKKIHDENKKDSFVSQH